MSLPYGLWAQVDNNSVSNQTGSIELNLRRANALINSNIDSARGYLLNALSSADSVNNIGLQADIGRQLGNSYWAIGSYNLALDQYLKALSHYETLDNHLGTALIYNNIGEVYKKLGDLDASLSYHSMSLQHKIRYVDAPPLMSYSNLGELYLIKGNQDTAKYFFQKLVQEANQDVHKRELALAYGGLGTINAQYRRMPVAVDFHEMSLALSTEIKDYRGIAVSYMDLARVYLQMGRHSGAARIYIDSANTVLNRLGATDLIIENLLLMAKVDSIQGRYLQSISNFQRHFELKDSLYTLQRSYQVNELLTRYEIEKTQRENEALLFERSMNESELATNRNTILMISFGLIVAVILSIRLVVSNNMITKQRSELSTKAGDLEIALGKLEVKNEENRSFSYTVSHDLKAPIRVISYYTNLLKEEWPTLQQSEIMTHLSGIGNNLKKMELIINDILDLSRISQRELDRKPVHLDKLAQELVDEFRIAYPNRDVDFICEKDLIVNADPGLMAILVKNLIENAWKYTQNRDKAVIKFQKYGTKTFLVEDNGVGFDTSYYDKLFEPFKRLHGDSEFEGTGIGLSIVKRILNKHDGTIWAKSTINEGSKFFFTLS